MFNSIMSAVETFANIKEWSVNSRRIFLLTLPISGPIWLLSAVLSIWLMFLLVFLSIAFEKIKIPNYFPAIKNGFLICGMIMKPKCSLF